MSVLLGGIGSAMLLAGKSIPASNAVSTAEAEAARAIEELVRESTYATTVSSLGARAITFTLPDRSHGAAGQETVTYSWSGTIGDPLTRTYNGSSPVTIASGVKNFSINSTTIVGKLRSAPRVLMIVQNANALTAGDTARKALIDAQGWPIAVLADECTTTDFRTAAANCDVVYVSEEVDGSQVADKIANIARGVVTEETGTFAGYGIGTGAYTWLSSSVHIQKFDHPITQGLKSNTTICTSSEYLTRLPTLGSGATILGDDGAGVPMLVTYEHGAKLRGGASAAARRVKMPWGGDLLVLSFSYSSLNNDAQKMLIRALAWAAAPVKYANLSFSLETTAGPIRDSTAQLISKPPVSAP